MANKFDTKRAAPTKEEIWEAIESADNPRQRALIKISCLHGLRSSELAGIRFERKRKRGNEQDDKR